VRPPDRIVRHRLADRVFHWVMAASVLALLATGFLPILGVRFAWVTIHWIAGLVLGAAVLFHVVRALAFLEPSSMMVWPADLRDAWRAVRRACGGRAVPGKPGKYLLLQKLYHHAIALVLLTTIATGLAMMVKIDTPFWTRDPYWLADSTWGLIYVLHDLAALTSITLLMVHVYFAFRPEKLWLTRSMVLGWITRAEYAEQHDPARWRIATEEPARRQPAASGGLGD
jgi:cytochrome b subunit of formate dehydrogenase